MTAGINFKAYYYDVEIVIAPDNGEPSRRCVTKLPNCHSHSCCYVIVVMT
jgi:hypothetical protein